MYPVFKHFYSCVYWYSSGGVRHNQWHSRKGIRLFDPSPGVQWHLSNDRISILHMDDKLANSNCWGRPGDVGESGQKNLKVDLELNYGWRILTTSSLVYWCNLQSLVLACLSMLYFYIYSIYDTCYICVCVYISHFIYIYINAKMAKQSQFCSIFWPHYDSGIFGLLAQPDLL